MNLNQELSERLFTMMNLMHALRRGGRPEGRGYAQDRALRAIASQEGVTQRALMEALDVRPSSISELLTKLENGGLIERRPNPDDRRQMRLYLSDSGRAQAARLGEDAPLPDLFEALTDEERQQYLALTDRMIDALTRACEERGIPADRSFGHGGPRPFGHGPGRGGRGFHAEDEGRGFDGHPHRDGRDFDGNGGRRGGRSFYAEDEGRGFDGHPHHDGRDFDGKGGKRGGRGFHDGDENRDSDGHPHHDGRDFDGNGGRRGGRGFHEEDEGRGFDGHPHRGDRNLDGNGGRRDGRGFHAEDEGRGFDDHPHRDGRDFDGKGGNRGDRGFDSNRGAENGRGRNSRNEPAGTPSAASDSICDGCGKGCKLTRPDCGHGARLARERGISTRNGSGR